MGDDGSRIAPFDRIVVVGASLAGLRTVEALRRGGFAGELTLVGEERDAPYDRPPLSKEFLAGRVDAAAMALRRAESFDQLSVTLRLGSPATGLDVEEGIVYLGLERIPFDALVIATGCSARRLPMIRELVGVHTIRTLSDAIRLRAELSTAASLVIVGAGFIGSEVASVARASDIQVTVLEALEQPLMRALGKEVGAVCGDLHRTNGTHLRCGVKVVGVEGEDRVTGVRLDGGEVVPADVVLVAAGTVPGTDWLAGSGLTIADGVVCDAGLRAHGSNVFAVGDVARWPNATTGLNARVEHWTNAGEQAMAVARALLAGGDATPHASVPYFWSDQYGIRMQFVGASQACDEVRIVHRGPGHEILAAYRSGQRLAGVFSIGLVRPVMRARALIAARSDWAGAITTLEEAAASTPTTTGVA